MSGGAAVLMPSTVIAYLHMVNSLHMPTEAAPHHPRHQPCLPIQPTAPTTFPSANPPSCPHCFTPAHASSRDSREGSAGRPWL